MPRDKRFDKRGGGKRLDAISAEEIEIRNAQLEEFEESRERRRAEEDEEDGAEDGGDAEPTPSSASSKPPPDEAPKVFTSAEEHARNQAKLEAVRKRREQAEERRKAEKEAEEEAERERKAKVAELQEESGSKKSKKSKSKSIPKLSKIEIKKMKPALLKEALKERGLDYQGNAKALTERLLKYEAER